MSSSLAHDSNLVHFTKDSVKEKCLGTRKNAWVACLLCLNHAEAGLLLLGVVMRHLETQFVSNCFEFVSKEPC